MLGKYRYHYLEGTKPIMLVVLIIELFAAHHVFSDKDIPFLACKTKLVMILLTACLVSIIGPIIPRILFLCRLQKPNCSPKGLLSCGLILAM